MFWTTTRATTIISAAQNHLKPSSSSQRNDRRSLVVTNVTKVIAKKRDLFFPILFSFVKDIFFSHLSRVSRSAEVLLCTTLILLLLNTLRSFPRDYSPFLRVLLTSFSSSTNTTFDKISQIKSGCWMPRIAKNHERATWTECRPHHATVRSKPST